MAVMAETNEEVPNARLRGLRAEKKLSQGDMAEILGISESAYLAKENGKRDFKSSEMIAVKRYFKLNAEEIFRTFF